MADDDRDKWYRTPISKVKKIKFKKHINKVENATIKHAHKFIVKRWSNILEVQRNVILWVLTVGLLILATGFQLAWYQNGYKVNAESNDGTYAEAVMGPVNTLNPLFAGSSAEQSISNLMFSRLFRYDKTGHLNYDLASDISIDKTNKIYTVKIRSDALWHDGSALTAHDVAFTIELIKNPNSRSTITGWDDVSVRVLSDYDIQFTLQSTYAAFEHVLTFPIVPKNLLKDVLPANIRENNFSKNPIGSGPFKLRLVQKIDSMTNREAIYLVRNDSYYGGRASLARYQVHVYETRDAILRSLSQNEVNAAADLLPTDLSNIDLNRYTVVSKPINSGVYAIINTKSQLLKNVDLRKALRYATDAEAIRNKLSDSALPLELPFIANQVKGGDLKVPQNDANRVDELLNSAGWVKNKESGIREKDGKELRLTVVAMKDSEFENVLETLVGQWRSFGITIDTKIVDPNDVTQNVAQTILRPRDYDVLLYRLNIGADPDVYAYWHSSQASEQGSNFSNYSNIISDDALSSARSRLEPDLRNAKYVTFARQWINDVPAIGLYQSTSQYVYNSKIKSLDDDAKLVLSSGRYSDVLNWSVGSRKVYRTP